MERALALAVKAKGRTSPNPMVGAVIVKSGKVIAEGYHREAGGDHAEVAAIKKAKKETKGSTLYGRAPKRLSGPE
jgi:diaminohydroxyphosphoribosylaminopyrimidine deaminase/5-amino-6-(5-phosphoribosylamino)uracil reductase